MARLNATAVLLSSVLSAACLDNAGPNPGEQIFESSLDEWNTEGPDSYDMVLRRQTISLNPDLSVLITVRNGVVTSRTYDGTTIPVEPGNVTLYPDVPGLFAFLKDAMDSDPFLLSAEYDETYSYPQMITLDRFAGRTDDNVVYTVTSFTAIE
jgi:hypothetical protein